MKTILPKGKMSCRKEKCLAESTGIPWRVNPSLVKGLERKPFIFIPLSNNELRHLVLGMYSFWGIFLRIRARVKKDYWVSPGARQSYCTAVIHWWQKKHWTFLFNESHIFVQWNEHLCKAWDYALSAWKALQSVAIVTGYEVPGRNCCSNSAWKAVRLWRCL